mmetsp:Transcript_16808/g.28512  ORF Transcript_16808/g.28512 Transcript_16808/m.28512 type:complete len:402 (+) Transcript_16808:29-1234(+)
MMESKHLTIINNKKSEEDVCKVFLDDELLEADTKKQIQAMVAHEPLSHTRVMPDCHNSHGCCVGFTSIIDIYRIVPSFIGGDIGCGILTYPLGKSKMNLSRVEKIIRDLIPMGVGQNNIHSNNVVEDTFIARYLDRAHKSAIHIASSLGVDPPRINFDYFVSLCSKIGIDLGFCIKSFGTLGGGNHFLELNQDEETSELYLTVHSGSRNFGMKLFEYHNSKIQLEAGCLNAEDSLNYAFDMVLAQTLASMNRHIMLQLILRQLSIEYHADRLIESTHNYIDFNKKVLRKGAISAERNEMCIVALNMRDGILLCEGKGNVDWNWSCAHGCGRVMSRSEARRRIKLKDFKRTMRDVVSSTICKETLDEAQSAYKDMAIIIEALEPTVTVIKRLISVVNLKATD